MRIPRLLFVIALLFGGPAVPRAAAEPFVFTGSTTASFNGGPFTDAGNFHGILFQGFSFVAESDIYQRLCCGGPLFTLGRLERTATNTVVNGDELVLRVAFTSTNHVTPNPLSLTVVLNTFPDVPGIIAVNSDRASLFTFDGGTAILGYGANNLRFAGEVSPIMGSVGLLELTDPPSTPEPATLLLLAGGIAVIGRRRLVRN